MSKRFLIPGDFWDTGLLEQWLEEKAARGWMPVSFSSSFQRMRSSPTFSAMTRPATVIGSETIGYSSARAGTQSTASSSARTRDRVFFIAVSLQTLLSIADLRRRDSKANQPLIEPIITPCAKYFCRKG